VYVGVDVWGRGQHGGGGLGSYRALAHIDPRGLGLSAALFGPAWTWESEQDKPGFDWQTWWAYERLLWVGPEDASQRVDVPDAPRREGEPVCPHGPFEPVTKFFGRGAPPEPAAAAFCATFSPGVGDAWFVEGRKVMDKGATGGWTDVDKQTSLGDLVWPRPDIAWEAENDQPPRTEAVPTANASISFDDAWLGGSSLRLSVSGAGSDAEDAFFRCVWVPVQSVALRGKVPYHATLVYKLDPQDGEAQVEVDMGLAVKMVSRDGSTRAVDVTPVPAAQAFDLPGGWSRTTVLLNLDTGDSELSTHVVAVGLVIGFAAEDPTLAYKFSVLLGQLAVFLAPPPAPVSQTNPKILWASYAHGPAPGSGGLLEWEIAATLPALTSLTITSPDDPVPAWTLDATQRTVPAFAYFNVYVAPRFPEGGYPPPEQATFVGTTGLDGRANRFFVDEACLPETLRGAAKDFRLHVQGVTDRGVVLKWDRCAFVNAASSAAS
jgi:mannosyl-glycoprotein endo-beta-N-acetylglucosaminidase